MDQMKGLFVVGASKGVLPSGSFTKYRGAVESHLASLPRFKTGSVEVVGIDGSLLAVVSVSGEETRDQVRQAAANAVRALQNKGASGKVVLDGASLGDEESALEGSLLGAHSWSLKMGEDKDAIRSLQVELLSGKRYEQVEVAVQAELEARVMASLPANMLTPTMFCNRVKEAAQSVPQVEVRVFEEDELRRMGMQVRSNRLCPSSKRVCLFLLILK
jgi:leucyl aminopeptidase